MRPLKEIIVHCTATRPDWWATRTLNQQVAEIRRWHVEERKWKDIGYHFLIGRSGAVAPGRPLERVGAHVEGHNTNTIGVALFGGHGSAATDPFSRNFTPEQDVALRKLIDDLRSQYPSITKVTGHNNYARKACPGFDVPAWYASGSAAPARAAVFGLTDLLSSIWRNR
jgi:N-acetylmuramoyl-L-alanine amidase